MRHVRLCRIRHRDWPGAATPATRTRLIANAGGARGIDNWNEQAAKSAESYLDTSGFSRSGLIQQLEFEGYTAAQAAYGVSQAGL